MNLKRCLLLLCFGLLTLGLATSTNAQTALWRAHAHNDYEQERPLEEALERGIGSVEVDIHLVEGALLVAHDLEDVEASKTLESMYLAPLRKHITDRDGRVYDETGSLVLLIDIKSDAEATYAALKQQLEEYEDILTRFEAGEMFEGPVTAIISGNRPRETMMEEEVRWAAYDGRLSDLESKEEIPVSFMPLISSSWMQIARWYGHGTFSESAKEKLYAAVQQAHKEGRKIRFWATSDNERVWEELYSAGVDYLNADDLAGVQDFLLRKMDH